MKKKKDDVKIYRFNKQSPLRYLVTVKKSGTLEAVIYSVS